MAKRLGLIGGARPPVFIRLIPPKDPRSKDLRAAGYYAIRSDGSVPTPYEIIHAPGFGMWTTTSKQQGLEKLLARRSVSDVAGAVIILTPENELLGRTSFAAAFDPVIEFARLPQPADARLALLVGLVASAFENPNRVWPNRLQVREEHGTEGSPDLPEEPLPSVLPDLGAREKDRAGETALGLTIIRLAMLRALPAVLETLPEDGGREVVRDTCSGLLEWVLEALWPMNGDEMTLEETLLRKAVDGRDHVFNRELLSFPRSVQEELFDRVVGAEDSLTLQLYRQLARGLLTPGQMSAIMMKLWSLKPIDGREEKRLHTALSRARTSLRARDEQGGL